MYAGRYIVILCGIPDILSDEIEKRREKFQESGKWEILSHPLAFPWSYSEDYFQHIYSLLSSRLRDRLSPRTSPEASRIDGVMTIYVDYGETPEVGQLVEEHFAVESLVQSITVPKVLGKGHLRPNEIKMAANAVLVSARSRMRKAENALSALTEEIQSRDNRTPLLLPVENFGGKELPRLIQTVQKIIVSSDPPSVLKKIVNGTRLRQVRQGPDRKFHFANTKGIVFRSPGTNRHALAWEDGVGHLDRCWTRSRIRLGIQYDPRFHYDCVKDKGKFPPNWPSCHGQDFAAPSGAKHVNVAPNDYVRKS